ncbi:MAG: Hsp20/alpha crystallin family protein [FCB group bacterium]|nr:Hsp20/alpha crystallin family protein [FCB group bacterium]
MAWRTWDPWREMDALRREINRVLEGAGNGDQPFARAGFLPGRAARAYPLLNMHDDKDNVYIEALAPGLNTESLQLTVHRDTLRMEGEKQAISQEVKPEAWHRSERSAGRFVRTVTMPAEVDSDKVSASYQNGILRITMPKAEKAKPRQIAVNVQ